MLSIGLTGGIASGKTTISDLFSALGVPIIDADVISRSLLDIDQPGYVKLVDYIGDSILFADRKINRPMLRELVFNERSIKYWLETMLHPLIYASAQHQVSEYLNSAYVVVVVPLLFEADFITLADRILVVDCPQTLQIERLIKRDNIDAKLALEILKQQWANHRRLERADDIIHNRGADNLEIQVAALHEQYWLFASQKGNAG